MISSHKARRRRLLTVCGKVVSKPTKVPIKLLSSRNAVLSNTIRTFSTSVTTLIKEIEGIKESNPQIYDMHQELLSELCSLQKTLRMYL